MEISQLPTDGWEEIASPVYFCVIPFYPEQITSLFKVAFQDVEEDGLGLCKLAYVNWCGIPCMLKAFPNGPEISQYVCVFVLSFEERWSELKKAILGSLNIKESELIHQQSELSPASWVLTRVDDNGNEIEMFRFSEEHSAQSVKSSYESRGHKQHYYVNRAT